jgi:hypothetical protein
LHLLQEGVNPPRERELSPPLNSYAPDCRFWMAVTVVLVTGVRHVQIHWKYERVSTMSVFKIL